MYSWLFVFAMRSKIFKSPVNGSGFPAQKNLETRMMYNSSQAKDTDVLIVTEPLHLYCGTIETTVMGE